MIRAIDSSETLWLEVRYRIAFDKNLGDTKNLRQSLNGLLGSSEAVINVHQISEIGDWVYEVVQIVRLEGPDLVSLKRKLRQYWDSFIVDDTTCKGISLQWTEEVDKWYAELM